MSTERQSSPPSPHAANPRSMETQPYSAAHDSDGMGETPADSTPAAERKEDIGPTSSNTLPRPVGIPNWPGTVTLARTPQQKAKAILVNILMPLPPLFFIALIVLAVHLRFQPLSNLGKHVRRACLLGPTLFPIAFSAIVGWCLKLYGRFKSERGVKLGELERVIGSQTLFSSLKLAFQFKQLDVLSIVLVVLWVLSPLGGQSILRMISETNKGYAHLEMAEYFNTYAESHFVSASGSEESLSEINGLYISSIFSSIAVKNGPIDLWGNVKIPSFEPPNSNSTPDDEWLTIDYSKQLRYTSLLGIPVNTTFSTAAQSTFTLNTTSFTAHCDDPIPVNWTSLPSPSNDATFVIETYFSPNGDFRRHLSLITFPQGTLGGLIHNCTVFPNFLLAEVDCHFGNCTTSRIKKFPDPDGEITRSPLIAATTWMRLASLWPSSTGHQHAGSGSQTERYLYDPQSNQGGELGMRPDLSQVPTVELSKRFTTLLNTYYQASLAPKFRLSGLTHDGLHNPFEVTVASVIRPSDIYICHWEWIALGFIASIAMLAAAIVSILLEKRVLGPDIYGYVSSMTRDTPYFSLPPNGCMLDGSDRAVLLKDVMVRLEDVAPSKTVGHVAFTMVGHMGLEREAVDGRLRVDKPYSGVQ